ncbi:MAG: hypothetical protein MUC42_06600, partial [Bryobacter sp.]|nr:hypothetical protein [Bryobacter sp.]
MLETARGRRVKGLPLAGIWQGENWLWDWLSGACKRLIPKADWLWEIGFTIPQVLDFTGLKVELGLGRPFFEIRP